MSVRVPAEAFHAGEFIREELEARNWTQTDLSEILGLSFRLVNELINAKRSVTPETAKALAEAFDTDPQYWMNLESAYQLWRVHEGSEGSQVARRASLFVKAPVGEMIRRRWIEPSNDVTVLEGRILSFLGIKTLDEAPKIWHAAKKSTSYQEVTPAQSAWLMRARQIARPLQVGSFTEVSFEQALGQLKELLPQPKEIRHVPRILAEAGIRFVVLQHLEHTKIDGACLWLDRAPVVALSIRYDRVDTFWFALLHELGHVKRRDGLDQYEPLDVRLFEGGILTDADRPPEETEANRFATEFLIPQKELEDFINRNRPLYWTRQIQGFAALRKIHPGIVIGQLQYRKEISYAHGRQLQVKVRDIIAQTALTDGWGHTVPAGL